MVVLLRAGRPELKVLCLSGATQLAILVAWDARLRACAAPRTTEGCFSHPVVPFYCAPSDTQA